MGRSQIIQSQQFIFLLCFHVFLRQILGSTLAKEALELLLTLTLQVRDNFI